MKNKVYVAAPYHTAEYVCHIHEQLRAEGFEPTSVWAGAASGPEGLRSLPVSSRMQIRKANDAALRSADFCLVVDHEGVGRETYCEMARAEEWKKTILFVGREMLSGLCPPTVACETVPDAIRLLKELRVWEECS